MIPCHKKSSYSESRNYLKSNITFVCFYYRDELLKKNVGVFLFKNSMERSICILSRIVDVSEIKNYRVHLTFMKVYIFVFKIFNFPNVQFKQKLSTNNYVARIKKTKNTNTLEKKNYILLNIIILDIIKLMLK